MVAIGDFSQFVTQIIGAVAIVACVVVWFVYTKLVLKE